MLVDNLVEECTETVKEVKLAKRTSTENENVCKYSSCTLYIVLFSIIFAINVGIDPYFVYYKYINGNKKIGDEKRFNYQTTFDYWSYKMATYIKSINIKNGAYYFFNGIINIEVFYSNLLKIDKKSYKNFDIYYTGYITIKKTGDYENIYSVNPLYLIIGEVDGFIEEENESKYLVFDSADKNREWLEKYA